MAVPSPDEIQEFIAEETEASTTFVSIPDPPVDTANDPPEFLGPPSK